MTRIELLMIEALLSYREPGEGFLYLTHKISYNLKDTRNMLPINEVNI